MINCQYVYLLKEREFVKTGEDVYKFGKTKKPNVIRFLKYPKGSLLLMQIDCNNCDATEDEMKKVFGKKYKQRTDIGKEYFEGNYVEMMYDICDIVKKINSKYYKILIDPLCIKNNKIDIIGNIDNCDDSNEDINFSNVHKNKPKTKEIKKVVGNTDNKKTSDIDKKQAQDVKIDAKNVQIKINNYISKSDNKKFVCDKCLRIFSNRSHYTRHVKANACVRNDISKYKFSCNKCNKKFTRRTNLNKHLKRDICSNYIMND